MLLSTATSGISSHLKQKLVDLSATTTWQPALITLYQPCHYTRRWRSADVRFKMRCNRCSILCPLTSKRICLPWRL